MATIKRTTTSQTQTQRRNLSSSASSSDLLQPKAKVSSMDPTLLKKHTPKSATTTTTTTKKPHPSPPDPIVGAPPSSTTIQNISNHFAKLYANHKILAPLKPSHPNTHFQEKALNDSSALHNSCVALTKSSSQHGRIHHGAEDFASGKGESNCTHTKVKEKDNNKYSTVVNVKKKPNQVVEVDAQKALLDGHKFNCKDKKSSGGVAQKQDKHKKEEFYDGRRDVKKASGSGLMSKSLELEKLNEVMLCEKQRSSISLAVNGRRKSFCCSQAELADFFSCTGVKVVAVDMPPFMQIHAVDSARKACDSLEKFTSKTLAFTLKKEFDGVYGPAWHCIVGTSFGSFVTHSVGGFMYFSIDQKLYILLFKTTVQRAD